MMRLATTGLLAIVCGLTAVLTWEVGIFTPPASLALPPTRVAATAAKPITRPSHESEWLATVLARPLFSPDRRPPSESSVVEGNPIPDGLPRLAGVMVGPFGRSAIFAIDGGTPVVLREGGRVNAWTVRLIRAGEVELEGPGGTRTVHPSFQSSPEAPNDQPSFGQRTGLSPKQ
jgi:hypothetical protein